jgi:hypothetical protein
VELAPEDQAIRHQPHQAKEIMAVIMQMLLLIMVAVAVVELVL